MKYSLYKITKYTKLYGAFGGGVYLLRRIKHKTIAQMPSKKRALMQAKEEQIKLDQKYGIETTQIVGKEALFVESDNLKYAGSYEPTPWINFVELLAPYNLSYENMSFIDLGAGKGRVLFMAAALPFRNVIGVEFFDVLAEITKENIKNFPKENIQCANISVLCLDAVEYRFPKDGVVVFLYNPFDEPVMKTVISNLRESYRIDKRPILVIYQNPIYQNLWKQESYLNIIKEENNLQIYASNHFSRK
jgi:SAM-dependent methyltransferase